MARTPFRRKKATTQKYNSRKVVLPDGTKFDSKREYNRWLVLLERHKNLEIMELKRQVTFRFECYVQADAGEINGVGVHRHHYRYIADFTYYEGGKLIVEDCKGYRTDEYKRKKKWMKTVYGIDIRET